MTLFNQEQIDFLHWAAKGQLDLLSDMRERFEADLEILFAIDPMPVGDFATICVRVLDRLKAHRALFAQMAARPLMPETPVEISAKRDEILTAVLGEIDTMISKWSKELEGWGNARAEEAQAVWKKKLELERELAKNRAERFKKLWEKQRRV